MAKKKSKRKKKVSLASAALLLVASGAYEVSEGKIEAGIILILIGVALLFAAKCKA